MKYQRPGFTETTLLFAHYVDKNNINGVFNDNQSVNKIYCQFINWLYTACGVYDKTIDGTCFDIDCNSVLMSDVFIKFLDVYYKSLLDCDRLNLLIHKITNDKSVVSNFSSKFMAKNSDPFWYSYHKWYQILNNKIVLVINSFAPLMELQYKSGNLHKIDEKFPVFKDIISYRTPYTFFNNGPDANYFETLESMINEIQNIDFDVALVSCGAYACPIVDRIHTNKVAISMGSGIHKMFGIDPQSKENSPFILNKIPQEYIPENYMKIEGGRYWVSKNDK